MYGLFSYCWCLIKVEDSVADCAADTGHEAYLVDSYVMEIKDKLSL